MIVSITPDLALDVGYTYAGGLGVLEGDKFYAAAKLGIDYTVLTLFYRNGYVSYTFDDGGNPVPKPQPQPEEFLSILDLEDEYTVTLKGIDIVTRAWSYELGSAKAVFFEAVSPQWATQLTDRIYIERNLEEAFYKYTFLAKAAAAYIRRDVGLENVRYIDLQEAYTAILPLILRIPGKYRLVIHTPGPWGHPTFPKYLFEKELGYKLIGDKVVLTELGLAVSREAVTVSAKHFDVMSRVIPHFIDKVRYITNGINIERWMAPRLREKARYGNVSLGDFVKLKNELREGVKKLFRSVKGHAPENGMLTAWCRRLVPYKRPDFVARFVETHRDLDIYFLLAGKAHPYDGAGLSYMRLFRRLHRNDRRVAFIPEYTVEIAKIVLSGVDLLLFTPFPGWEASGTSFMKAGINGVPTLASRDGAVIELVVDEVNGWLFGEDIRSLMDFNADQEARRVNERDYSEFEAKLLKIYDYFNSDPEHYYEVALNAIRTFLPRVGIIRALREYYPDVVKKAYL
mgnify:CR=1 FL=1